MNSLCALRNLEKLKKGKKKNNNKKKGKKAREKHTHVYYPSL